ncbi:MAG: helix-turn-helix domain-containing protein [Acutalibacter sp.]
MTTGQKIQALRKGRGLTQEQLAARLGVSRQAVSRWELDETLPDTQNLLPLKEALGVSIDTLLDSTRGLEEPAPQAGPAPAAASSPARPSLGALLKRRFWLLLLPVELVLFVALAVWRLGKAPSLALLLLVQGLWLCLLLYLLLLVVYFLVWGIRYFQRHTRPPQ